MLSQRIDGILLLESRKETNLRCRTGWSRLHLETCEHQGLERKPPQVRCGLEDWMVSR